MRGLEKVGEEGRTKHVNDLCARTLPARANQISSSALFATLSSFKVLSGRILLISPRPFAYTGLLRVERWTTHSASCQG